VIVQDGNPAGITTPADLARTGVRIVAAGDAVPITGYADALVTKLATLDGYPAGFAAGYAANVVSREDDVSAVLAKIELAEGDAAIVYRTDALVSDGVSIVDIPPEANVAASYAGVVVKSSTHPREARAFLEWLTAERAQTILASHGYSPPAT
jgi:molybdate transport system substrate-binding protein